MHASAFSLLCLIHGADIYVGVLVPLTGPNYQSLLHVISAISVGFWAVNTQSNILPPGTKLVPVWKDDQSNALNCFFCALELSGTQCRDPSFLVRKTEMVIGPLYSANSQVACKVADKVDLPLLTVSTMSNLTQCAYFSRIIGNDTAMASVFSKVLQQFGWRSVGIIFASDDYSTTFAKVARASCESRGVAVSVMQSYFPGLNFSQLGPLSRLDTRVYLVFAYPADGRGIFAELKASGMVNPSYVYIVHHAMGQNSNTFVPEGTVRLYIDTPTNTEEYAKYAKVWNESLQVDPSIAFHRTVDISLPYGYDMVFLAARALAVKASVIQQCIDSSQHVAQCKDMITGGELQQIMRSITFRGVTGTVSLDSIGNRLNPIYSIGYVHGGKYKIVGWTEGMNNVTILAPIIWPDGTTRIPADVAYHPHKIPRKYIITVSVNLAIVYLLLLLVAVALLVASQRKGAHASPRRRIRAFIFLLACTSLNTAALPEIFEREVVAKWLSILAIFAMATILCLELRMLSLGFHSHPLTVMPYPRSLILPLLFGLVLQLALLTWWTIAMNKKSNAEIALTASLAIPAAWTLACVWEIWINRDIPGKYPRYLSVTISVYATATLQVLIWASELSPASFNGRAEIMRMICSQLLVITLLVTYFAPLLLAIRATPPKKATIPESVLESFRLSIEDLIELYLATLVDIERLTRALAKATGLVDDLVKQQFVVGEEVRFLTERSLNCLSASNSQVRGSNSSINYSDLNFEALILPDDFKEALWNKDGNSSPHSPRNIHSRHSRHSKGPGSPSKIGRRNNSQAGPLRVPSNKDLRVNDSPLRSASEPPEQIELPRLRGSFTKRLDRSPSENPLRKIPLSSNPPVIEEESSKDGRSLTWQSPRIVESGASGSGGIGSIVGPARASFQVTKHRRVPSLSDNPDPTLQSTGTADMSSFSNDGQRSEGDLRKESNLVENSELLLIPDTLQASDSPNTRMNQRHIPITTPIHSERAIHQSPKDIT